jgi:hypothetical protein
LTRRTAGTAKEIHARQLGPAAASPSWPEITGSGSCQDRLRRLVTHTGLDGVHHQMLWNAEPSHGTDTSSPHVRSAVSPRGMFTWSCLPGVRGSDSGWEATPGSDRHRHQRWLRHRHPGPAPAIDGAFVVATYGHARCLIAVEPVHLGTSVDSTVSTLARPSMRRIMSPRTPTLLSYTNVVWHMAWARDISGPPASDGRDDSSIRAYIQDSPSGRLGPRPWPCCLLLSSNQSRKRPAHASMQ